MHCSAATARRACWSPRATSCCDCPTPTRRGCARRWRAIFAGAPAIAESCVPCSASSRIARPLVQDDDDVAAGIEAGGGAGRHDTGCVVFLDDQGPAAFAGEVRAPQDRRVGPAGVAEVSRTRGRRLRLGAAGFQPIGNAGTVAQALAHDLDRDQLDRLILAGAMAVGLLVLAAE